MINLIINSLVIIKTIILTIWLQFWDCNRLFFFFHFFIRKKNLSYTSSREWYVEYAWHDSKISRHELVGAKQTVKVGGVGWPRAWFDIFFPLDREVKYLVDLRRWVEQVICKRRIDERSILTKRIYEATGNRGWNISFFYRFLFILCLSSFNDHRDVSHVCSNFIFLSSFLFIYIFYYFRSF